MTIITTNRTSDISHKAIIVVILIVAIEICSGCGGNKNVKKPQMIGKVVLDVKLPEDKMQAFEENDGRVNILSEVRFVFIEKKLYDPSSPVVMTITIDKYRLRSQLTAAAGQLITGGDYLEADISIRNDGRLIKQYRAKSGAAGAGLNILPAIDIAGMMGAIANTESLRMHQLIAGFGRLLYIKYISEEQE